MTAPNNQLIKHYYRPDGLVRATIRYNHEQDEFTVKMYRAGKLVKECTLVTRYDSTAHNTARMYTTV